jgi:hypothetical protein
VLLLPFIRCTGREATEDGQHETDRQGEVHVC